MNKAMMMLIDPENEREVKAFLDYLEYKKSLPRNITPRGEVVSTSDNAKVTLEIAEKPTLEVVPEPHSEQHTEQTAPEETQVLKPSEEIDAKVLLQECQGLLRRSHKEGKKDQALDIMRQLGIPSLSSVSTSQLLQFKEAMEAIYNA